MIRILPERPEDHPAVRAVNLAAFGRDAEADCVDAIRAACPEALSLVRRIGDEIVGQIFFSPVEIGGKRAARGMGLAPMAVLPEWQRQGIGTRLVEAGLAALREQGWPFVVVLGHPGFYPRFAFEPAAPLGRVCPWEGVPPEAFMVRALDPSVLEGVAGVVRLRSEFDAAI